MTQLAFGALGPWLRVSKADPRAAALADRHYSRQSPGDPQFMPPAKTLVLLTPCARAVWGVALNLDPTGELRWRCTIFRNEGAGRSSDLIVAATEATYRLWRRRYHQLPSVRLTTEVDPAKVRHKRDPGRCFLRAGWERLHVTHGSAHGRADLIVFGAPAPQVTHARERNET